MAFIRYARNDDNYQCTFSSNAHINLIGAFLVHDVQNGFTEYKDIASNPAYTGGSGNITFLEKEDGKIILFDMFPEDSEAPIAVKMYIEQFIQLLDEWDEKVYKPRPREVTIIYENDQYRIETKL